MAESVESVVELAEAVRRREVGARELVDRALERVEKRNAELNAFIHLTPERARAEADALDARLAAGEDPGPLAGIPFGVKDMDHCAGMPTSYGSLIHKGRPPETEDSVHVGRLRAAGAIPIGVTACSEFGTVQYTRTRAWGTTRNPWNPARTSGGSSGGSSTAVASGMVPFATAGDGGGSTRIPAAFTGLVGLKPSYGRIPREGAVTSQTSVWGALTTTVGDAARHLDVAAGPDDRDRTSLPPAGLVYEQVIETLATAGLRAAWSSDLGYARVDPEVGELAESAAGVLIEAAALRHVERPIAFSDPVKAWLGAGAIDIWLHLEPEEWPARAEEMVPHVRRSFEATAELTAPIYARILKRRTRLEQEVAALFRDIDVLLTPTTAVTAFDAAGPRDIEIEGHKVDPAMTVPYTMLANLCWNPAISLPAGLTAEGLPVGLQITAPRHRDDLVLRLARLFEQAQPWPRIAPGWD